MTERVMRHWLADEAGGPPSNGRLSMDRLRLHDGVVRRARYIARTWLLPGPQYVASIALPRQLSFAYVPLKIVHDLAMLPLWRIYRNVLAQAQRLSATLTKSDLALAIMPRSWCEAKNQSLQSGADGCDSRARRRSEQCDGLAGPRQRVKRP